MISLPCLGLRGTRRDNNNEITAIAVPAKKTIEGEYNQTMPNMTGITTAAMWLMVNATPEVEAISAGSAIF